MANATHDYSTYSQVTLSQVSSVCRLIRKYSASSSESRQSSFHLSTLLTLKEIEEALINPQSAIKLSMKAFASVLGLYRECLAAYEQAEIQRAATEYAIRRLREKYAMTTENALKQIYGDSLTTLEDSYRTIVERQRYLSELASELKVLENKIADLTFEFDKEWDDYREKYLDILIQQLEKGDVPLTDLEKKELQTQESWPELLRRFQTLELEVPSYIKIEPPSPSSYFMLKAYLAINASLGRRMLPNTPEDLRKIWD